MSSRAWSEDTPPKSCQCLGDPIIFRRTSRCRSGGHLLKAPVAFPLASLLNQEWSNQPFRQLPYLSLSPRMERLLRHILRSQNWRGGHKAPKTYVMTPCCKFSVVLWTMVFESSTGSWQAAAIYVLRTSLPFTPPPQFDVHGLRV